MNKKRMVCTLICYFIVFSLVSIAVISLYNDMQISPQNFLYGYEILVVVYGFMCIIIGSNVSDCIHCYRISKYLKNLCKNQECEI